MATSKIQLSPHSLTVYRLLARGQPLTAQQIAQQLNLLPPAIYRLAQKLEAAGLIEKLGKYPSQYQAKQPNQAIEAFLLLHRNWLQNQLGKSPPINQIPSNSLDISFLQGKKAHINQFIKDVPLAQKEIKFIIVGLEVPAEVILAQKRALDRGVAFKILVQYVTDKNRLMLQSWIKMDFDVRSCPPIGGHLFLFDTKIAYLGAYDPHNPETRIVVRFANPSIAETLNDIFETRWKKSKPIE